MFALVSEASTKVDDMQAKISEELNSKQFALEAQLTGQITSAIESQEAKIQELTKKVDRKLDYAIEKMNFQLTSATLKIENSIDELKAKMETQLSDQASQA